MYYISFRFNLNIEGDRICIPSFAEWKDEEKPISISHPDVVKIFESEPAIGEIYGIVETTSQLAAASAKDSGRASIAVAGLAGEVHAKKVSEISKSVSKSLSKKLGEHLVKCSSEINQDEFCTDERNDDLISQIRETLTLRDFWGRYVMSDRKKLKKGYIFVIKS
jgi:hypothetical protein